MYLQYADDVPGATLVALCNTQQHRVELYILANSDEQADGDSRCSLVAVAGRPGEHAERVKLQGPYENRAQALAARAAIVQQLQARDYSCQDSPQPCWRLTAQRAIRELRSNHKATQGDYRFKPEDVYFD